MAKKKVVHKLAVFPLRLSPKMASRLAMLAKNEGLSRNQLIERFLIERVGP